MDATTATPEAPNGVTSAEAADQAQLESDLAMPENGHGQSPVERLMAKLAEKYKEDGSERSADEQPPAIEKPKEEPAPTLEAKPKDEPAAKEETIGDAKSEIKLGKALQENKRLTTENLTLKKRAEEAEKRAKSVEELADRNPFKFLTEVKKKPLEEIFKEAGSGKYDEPSLPDEVQERLTKAEQFIKDAEEKAEQARLAEEQRVADEKAAEKRKSDRATVAKFVAAKESDFPLLGAIDALADDIVDEAYKALDRDETPDLNKIAAQENAKAREFLLSVFSNEKLMRVLAGDSAFVEHANKAFGGLKKQQNSSVSNPRANPKQAGSDGPAPQVLTSEVPTRSEREWTRDEERAEQIRLLRQFKTASRL